jgi:hypothetical protein
LTGNEEDGWGDFADEWWGKFFVSLLGRIILSKSVHSYLSGFAN